MEFTTKSNAKKQTGLSYLGSINSSAKMIKNQKVSNNYTYILYLSPAGTSGYDVCPHSTPECRIGCLASSGRVKMELRSKDKINTIQSARVKKTRLFFEHREFFLNWMIAEIKTFQEKAKKDGYDFSIRLNGTSDIEWEHIEIYGETIFDIFPEVQFYDYCKNPARMLSKKPKNYHLTFSYNGRNENITKRILERGGNVAVIYDIPKGKELPSNWNGYPVIDGDLTDYRPNDPKGTVVGLRWKDIGNRNDNEYVKNSSFVTKVINVPEKKYKLQVS